MLALSFADTSSSQTYTLSLHDALPIYVIHSFGPDFAQRRHLRLDVIVLDVGHQQTDRRKHAGIKRHDDAGHAEITCDAADRKSTRLNSSHLGISYAVFCLKKKSN